LIWLKGKRTSRKLSIKIKKRSSSHAKRSRRPGPKSTLPKDKYARPRRTLSSHPANSRGYANITRK